MDDDDSGQEIEDPELQAIWTYAMASGRAFLITRALEIGHVISDDDMEVGTAGVAAGIAAAFEALQERGWRVAR